MSSDVPPDWYPDPVARHEFRYWDGTRWTGDVASNGQHMSDPLDSGAQSAEKEIRAAKKVQKQARKAGAVAGAWQGTGSPLTEPILVVNQKPKLVEVNAEYAIFDQHGQRIGAVQEVGRSFLKNVLGPWPDSSKAKRLNVVDVEGRVVLTLSRPSAILRSTVIVRRADGTEVGRIVQKNLGLLGSVRFALESGGKKLGSINGEDWTAWDFSIQNKAGDEIARITKSWSGPSLQISRKKDRYVVQIHRELEDPLRSLVVASALVVDTVLKQQ